MHFKYFILTFIALSFLAVSAQEDPAIALEHLLEQFPEELEGELDLEATLERLQFLIENPLDINSASRADLEQLLFLSPLLIQKIIEYRTITQGFISITELQAIDGMELELARLASRFLVVKERGYVQATDLHEALSSGKHDVVLRYGRVLEKSRGYNIEDQQRSRYLGSPARWSMRYRLDYQQRIKLAINLEKDPGEPFFGPYQKLGFDYISMSMQIKSPGWIQNMVLGDFTLQFGQGLGMWMGYGLGKSSVLHGVAKLGAGVRPHTSFDEASFLRGIAASIPWHRWTLTPFFSLRQRDGSLRVDADSLTFVQSLSKSGLHRTPSELANKGAVRQTLIGTDVQWAKGGTQAGATVFRTWTRVPVIPQPLPRNYYQFSGDAFSHLSLYYRSSLGLGFFFGEASFQPQGGIAVLQGALLSLDPSLSLGVVYRHYDARHHSPFGGAFGEGQSTSNESGFYLGLQYQPSRRFSAVAYLDKFHFPWLRFRIDQPSEGMDLLCLITYSWNRETKMNFRLRYKEKDENQTVEASPFPLIVEIRRTQARLDFRTDISDRIAWRSRLDYSQFTPEGMVSESGWMFYQDIFYTFRSLPLSINARTAYFQTSGSNTRMYVFESDVMFASTTSFYQYKGWRLYMNARWRLSRNMDFWVKYGITGYLDRQAVGTGLDQIDGTDKSELKVQLRLRL